jgi:hypothetical protein
MKLLDIPVGLLFNFHELILTDGLHRRMVRGSDRVFQHRTVSS